MIGSPTDIHQHRDAVSPGRSPLLVTKLAGPRLRGDYLVRQRLLDAIGQAPDRKLTLISTPPGYGKTTLAARWRAWSEQPSVWVSLDESDNDPIQFFSYVVAAVETIDAGLCRETREILTRQVASSSKVIVSSFINEVAAVTRPFTIVLDDFHVIDAPEILEATKLLLQNMPDMMHMIITCRHDPPIPLLRMNARGELLELRARELSFVSEEVREYLRTLHSLDLGRTEIEAVEQWSEGWPVGLGLVARALQGKNKHEVGQVIAHIAENVQLVDDYLWEEILEQQPEEQRRFLLQTSVLSQFNHAACEVVTGSKDAASHLQSIERENLFLIGLEGRGHWFRYHPLFAEVLRDRLEREYSEAERLELYRRAAEWYESSGIVHESARYAVLAHDWDRAIRLLTHICADLFRAERLRTLRSWLENLPDHALAMQPELGYWLAWAHLRAGNHEEAARPALVAEREWTAAGNQAGAGKVLMLQLLKDLLSWDTTAGIERANRVLTLLEPDDIDDRARALILFALLQETAGDLARSETNLALSRALITEAASPGLQILELTVYAGLLLARGKLQEPEAIFKRIIRYGDEWNDPPVQNAYHRLAMIYLEWNRTEAVSEHLERVKDLASKTDAPLHLVATPEIQARLAWSREDWQLAFEEVEQAIGLCIRVGGLGFIPNLRELQCRLWLATGQLNQARSWAHNSGLDPQQPPEYNRLYEYLTLLRAMIFDNRSDKVPRLLSPLQASAESAGRFRELLEMHLIQAIAEWQLGNAEASAAAMERAFDIGAPEGFFQTFVREGPMLIPPLELAARHSATHRDYANSLLSVFGVTVKPETDSRPAKSDLLSTRETEVLQLVASGLSNSAIAETLFISEETVKTHLRRIFEKLNVSSRTQAVDRGRHLGLC
jgi:LuxR family maltose regulon positive regulatory protein